MKMSFLVLAMGLSASTTFANLNECADMMGTYKCAVQGQTVELKLNASSATELQISIAGEGQKLIIDGNEHKSTNDDSQYVGTCNKAAGIQVLFAFKSTDQQVSITKSSNGLLYKIERSKKDDMGNVVKDGEALNLNCTK